MDKQSGILPMVIVPAEFEPAGDNVNIYLGGKLIGCTPYGVLVETTSRATTFIERMEAMRRSQTVSNIRRIIADQPLEERAEAG